MLLSLGMDEIVIVKIKKVNIRRGSPILNLVTDDKKQRHKFQKGVIP